jgi:signal peptidase I
MEHFTEVKEREDTSTSQSPESDPIEHTPKDSLIGEVIRFALIALIVVLPIRIFIAQPFIVSGASMEDTFFTGQYLIIDQLTYHFEEPKRGEVIVFRYPKDPSKFFIKRIIGLPGDTIRIDGSNVIITNTQYPEGKTLDEPYVHNMRPGASITENLGSNEYFVMGDNRNASSDSRAWGVLQRDRIVGRAFVRLFPLSGVGIFPGEFNIEEHMKL